MGSSFAGKMTALQALMMRTGRMAALPVFLWILLCAGCQAPKGHVSTQESSYIRLGEIVVVGFRPAVVAEGGTGVIRSPLSGATFIGGPVPNEVVQRMTNSLLNKLVEDKSYNLISPGQARGVYSSIVFRSARSAVMSSRNRWKIRAPDVHLRISPWAIALFASAANRWSLPVPGGPSRTTPTPSRMKCSARLPYATSFLTTSRCACKSTRKFSKVARS